MHDRARPYRGWAVDSALLSIDVAVNAQNHAREQGAVH
jgi:hypothetical protein